MSRLDSMIQELCQDGVEYKTLDDLFVLKNGYTPSKKNDEYWHNGTVPWFRLEDIRTNGRVLSDAKQHVTSKAVKGSLFPANSIIVSTTATIGEHALIESPFLINQQLTCVSVKEQFKAQINIKFVFYYFEILKEDLKRIASQSGNMPIVSLAKMKQLLMPLPPLEVQEEIVRLLDDFTAKTAELQSELNKEFEARKKQYEHYEETLLNGNGATKIRLGDICHIKARIGWQGLTRKEYLHKGDYYLITGTDFSNGQVDFKNCHYVNKERYDQDANIQIQNNDVLVTKDGTLGKVAFVTGLDKPATLNAGVFVVRPTVDNINPRYLYYILASKHLMEFAKGRVTGGTIKHLNQSIIVDFPVPLLDFENQSEIVNMLDTVNALYNTLQSKISSEIESRQKQYEFYRDKLLTFKELNESEVN